MVFDPIGYRATLQDSYDSGGAYENIDFGRLSGRNEMFT